MMSTDPDVMPPLPFAVKVPAIAKNVLFAASVPEKEKT
jgi:hypothetical protein